MFQAASSFNQVLSSWDVSLVTEMNAMLQIASLFILEYFKAHKFEENVGGKQHPQRMNGAYVWSAKQSVLRSKKCNNEFHEGFLNEWLKKNERCPSGRVKLPVPWLDRRCSRSFSLQIATKSGLLVHQINTRLYTSWNWFNRAPHFQRRHEKKIYQFQIPTRWSLFASLRLQHASGFASKPVLPLNLLLTMIDETTFLMSLGGRRLLFQHETEAKRRHHIHWRECWGRWTTNGHSRISCIVNR